MLLFKERAFLYIWLNKALSCNNKEEFSKLYFDVNHFIITQNYHCMYIHSGNYDYNYSKQLMKEGFIYI